MRILLIGGNGFIGRFAVAALKQQGHTLAVFHRGTTDAPSGVDEIRGDRHQLNASAQELKRFAPDVVIDLVISSGPQAKDLMIIFRGAARRVVMLSSIDVYRATPFRRARKEVRCRRCRLRKSRSCGAVCIPTHQRASSSCARFSLG
jgi:nucleoside-diphosphate-sugar epimerase